MRVGAASSTLLLMGTDIHLFFLFSLLSPICSSFLPRKPLGKKIKPIQKIAFSRALKGK